MPCIKHAHLSLRTRVTVYPPWKTGVKTTVKTSVKTSVMKRVNNGKKTSVKTNVKICVNKVYTPVQRIV